MPWRTATAEVRAVFMFLGVFPLINALFDVVSYAVTLTLLRRGLRALMPVWLGILDLIIAGVLFLALGAVLTLVVATMNRLAGVALIDLGALFAGARKPSPQYFWLYAMLFSTILPTAAHFAVSLLGAQGVPVYALRRKVADWVRVTPDTTIAAALVPFAVGAVWAVPFLVVGTVGYIGWAVGGDGIRLLGGWYFDGLFWLADRFGAF